MAVHHNRKVLERSVYAVSEFKAGRPVRSSQIPERISGFGLIHEGWRVCGGLGRLRPAARFVLLLTLSAHASACADSDSAPESAARTISADLGALGIPVDSVSLEVFSRDHAFGSPYIVVLSGEILWVADRAGDPFLHMLDTASGQVLRSVGRRGQGPGEFRDATSLLRADEDSSAVWLYDWRNLMLVRFTRFSYFSAAHRTLRTLSLGDSPLNIGLFPYSFGRDRILIFERDDTPRIYTIDLEGRLLTQQDISPPGVDSISIRQRRRAFNSAGICTRKDGSGFALKYNNAARITLFDARAARLFDFDVPFPSTERFERTQANGELMFVHERDNYRGCAFSGDTLFALYSGAPPVVNGDAEESRQIHVFDGNGRLKRVLVLSTPVAAIELSAATNTLFAVSWSNATVYRARLR